MPSTRPQAMQQKSAERSIVPTTFSGASGKAGTTLVTQTTMITPNIGSELYQKRPK